MLALLQIALMIAFVACWVAAMVAYHGSTRHIRPDAKYVDRWTSEGLTERGAELRRRYWRIVATGGVIVAILALTVVLAPRA